MTTIEEYLAAINSPGLGAEAQEFLREQAQESGFALSKGADGQWSTGEGGAPPDPAPSGEMGSNQMTTILTLLGTMLDGGAGVDAEQVNGMIAKYLSGNKIQLSDLSSELQDMIGEDPVRFDVNLPDGWIEADLEGNPTPFPQPITDIIVSDLMVGNHVYIFGGAGTGKTYTTKKIAREILNVEVISVPCNQYTSPTELVGGQTIEGYKQGALIKAYTGEDLPPGKNGYLVLLDELPKLDPNTAGVLNDLLAAARDGDDISDGRLEKQKRNPNTFFGVVATGNVRLNETDPSYAGNSEQDRSLQDRFVGSCYRFVIDLKFEQDYMARRAALFIYIYLVQLRFYIQEQNMQNVAFVSLRLMNAVWATYNGYMSAKKKGTEAQAKTPQQAMESFFSLFNDSQIADLKKNTPYGEFLSACKIHMDMDEMKNLPAEPGIATKLTEKYTLIQEKQVAYLDRFGKP